MNLYAQKLIAFIMLTASSPILLISFLLIKSTSKGPFIFRQKRAGINKKPFTIYKIRTMNKNAEKDKSKYLKLNEADGPVFKIKNDPRYTKIGKFLAKYGLDEIPQLINVLKGEMAIVGPRPLPLSEADKIPAKYNLRFSILPGMTSTWVIAGNHKLKFKKWMEMDIKYTQKRSTLLDIKVIYITIYQQIVRILRNS